MEKWSNVRKNTGNFLGTGLKIEEFINKTIRIVGYSVGDSKYNGKCVTLQFRLYEDVKKDDGTTVKEWVDHIWFTGSESIIRDLDGAEINPDDPPYAKIIKQDIGRGRFFYKIVDPD